MTLDLTRQHILIVDDKPTNLKVLAATLTGAGFDIAVATNGKMALQQVAEDPPELILLDILMPEMDGFETCRQLKVSSTTEEIPVIFMTALSDTVDKVKGLSLGAVDYITKPFETEEVLARVNTHLQLRSLTKNLEERNQQLSEVLKRLQSTQEKMIAQERLATIGTLTAGIVHELRNPLNFVKNYAEGSIELINDLVTEIQAKSPGLASEATDTMSELVSELRENASDISRHAQRAEYVIKDMLAQASSDNNQPQLTEINSLLDQAVKISYKSQRAQGLSSEIKINTNYDETNGKLMVVRSQLSRAFINLVDNACYALQMKQQSPQIGEVFNPQIWIKTQNLGNSVTITIRDNGIGIPPAIQGQIFKPFFSTKPTNQGTGLGLSLTREIIVAKHNGTLSIKSEAGAYTEFIIEIPIT